MARLMNFVGIEGDKKLRLGFVGCGAHAKQSLYPSIRFTPFKLVSVCAKHIESAQRTALEYGAEKFYIDYKAMIQEGNLDAIIVCANKELHYEIGMYALEQGLHVFIEKPPAPTTKESKEMIDLAKKQNKYLMVGFNRRFAPCINEMKKIVENKIENPHFFHGQFCIGETIDEWQLLSEIGIHYFDLARFFFGDVENLQVQRNCLKDNFVTLIINLSFANGKIGVLHLSNRYLWAKPSEEIHIYGDEASVSVKNMQLLEFNKSSSNNIGEIPDDGEKTMVWQPNYSHGSEKNQYFFLNGYGFELLYFYDSIVNNQAPMSNIEDAHKALEIAERVKNI